MNIQLNEHYDEPSYTTYWSCGEHPPHFCQDPGIQQRKRHASSQRRQKIFRLVLEANCHRHHPSVYIIWQVLEGVHDIVCYVPQSLGHEQGPHWFTWAPVLSADDTNRATCNEYAKSNSWSQPDLRIVRNSLHKWICDRHEADNQTKVQSGVFWHTCKERNSCKCESNGEDDSIGCWDCFSCHWSAFASCDLAVQVLVDNVVPSTSSTSQQKSIDQQERRCLQNFCAGHLWISSASCKEKPNEVREIKSHQSSWFLDSSEFQVWMPRFWTDVEQERGVFGHDAEMRECLPFAQFPLRLNLSLSPQPNACVNQLLTCHTSLFV